MFQRKNRDVSWEGIRDAAERKESQRGTLGKIKKGGVRVLLANLEVLSLWRTAGIHGRSIKGLQGESMGTNLC